MLVAMLIGALLVSCARGASGFEGFTPLTMNFDSQGRVLRSGQVAAPSPVPGTRLTDKGAAKVHATAQKAFAEAYEAGVREMGGWDVAKRKGSPAAERAAKNAYFKAYRNTVAELTKGKFDLNKVEDGLKVAREAFIQRSMPEIRARAFMKSQIVSSIKSNPLQRVPDDARGLRSLIQQKGRYAYSAGHLQDHVVKNGINNIAESARQAQFDSFDKFLGTARNPSEEVAALMKELQVLCGPGGASTGRALLGAKCSLAKRAELVRKIEEAKVRMRKAPPTGRAPTARAPSGRGRVAARSIRAVGRYAGPALMAVAAAESLGKAASDQITYNKHLNSGVFTKETARIHHQNKLHNVVGDVLLGRGGTAALTGHLGDGVQHCKRTGARSCLRTLASGASTVRKAAWKGIKKGAKACHRMGGTTCAKKVVSAVGSGVANAVVGLGKSLHSSASSVASAAVDKGKRMLKCGFWASRATKAQCKREEQQRLANRRKAESQRKAATTAYHREQRQKRQQMRRQVTHFAVGRKKGKHYGQGR